MRHARWILLAAVSLSLLVSPSLLAEESDPYKAIFDGKTLNGWKGEAEHWRVEKGAIVGSIPPNQRLKHNTWLVWQDGKLEDFDLRLEFWLSGKPAANSGIQIRCQAESVTRVSGYQADLDMGATWLGRIYDEHGRALLVERGSRVLIQENGERVVETFARADRYRVLFRENEWNEYRVRGCGEHMTVEVNGTLFSELVDKQKDQKDLVGQLALQLHSGPETRIEFRNIRLRKLKPGSHRVKFKAKPVKPKSTDMGKSPLGDNGKPLNLGFEDGTLKDWAAAGEAFQGQPVRRDGIATRWPGQTSGKVGRFFVGGFEKAKDKPVGQLLSVPFEVTEPFASFLVGGGRDRSTRVEIVLAVGNPAKVIHTSSGSDREQMQRSLVDLRPFLGKHIQVRLVDENPGAWGHLNFDDFRVHSTKPIFAEPPSSPLTENPLLSRLVRNPASPAGENAKQNSAVSAAEDTVRNMHLPEGFRAEAVAAEPQLYQPIAFTFDDRGRIWVVEGLSYPQKRPGGKGLDRVLIFSDEDGDGRFESRKVFIEGLNLASGLEVGHGGVWIGVAPELLFIADRDGNDEPDSKPQVLLNGFGFQDTHETLNSFTWGPDGWLYGCQGVFNYSRIGKPSAADAGRVELRAGVWRYHPTRHEFEVFAHGGSNQWGLDFDEFGQLFMTHCRSRWGRGPTTHVVQGGHYWNQANRNYPDFVSGIAPAGYSHLRNFLLASARYGHGEGGAGKAGSRAVYGGHSHVGAMIYLGDNWPDTYRNHLLTHNLHGHQINHQVNHREGSGFNTLHAGHDVFFCEDLQHVGVDLKYGPDGAVYTIDWYDQRLCHNPNIEQWDRTNGRIYRISYAKSFSPAQVDLAKLDDHSLAKLLLHKNDWYVRHALRLLRERAADNGVGEPIQAGLLKLALNHPQASRRLRGLWALHAAGGFNETVALTTLKDPNEFVRAWTIQLLTDSGQVSPQLQSRLLELAKNDSSGLVRLYLASAMNRVEDETAWRIAESLSLRSEDATDRNLPKLIWFGMARLARTDLDRAFRFAEETQIPVLRNYVRWYAAKGLGDGLDRVVKMIADERETRQDLLIETSLALAGQHRVAMPENWPTVAKRLYKDDNAGVRRMAENLGAVFGDESLYPAKRLVLADRDANLADRQHAFRILSQAARPNELALFLSLLEDRAFRSNALLTLAGYADPKIGPALVNQLASFSEKDRTAALDTLTSREVWALDLLNSIGKGRVEKTLLSAYYVRQLNNLNSPAIDEKLTRYWGKAKRSSGEKLARVLQLEKSFNEAPLWAFNAGEGRKHFQKLCASCHRVGKEGVDIGPKLVGSGSKGARYFAENIIDPNAVIGLDFQTSVVITNDGRVVSGLIEQSNETAITVLTPTNPPKKVVIPRSEIESMKKTDQSLMPEQMLESLNQRQIIELFKYLRSI